MIAMVDMHCSANTKKTSSDATVAAVKTGAPVRGSTSALDGGAQGGLLVAGRE